MNCACRVSVILLSLIHSRNPAEIPNHVVKTFFIEVHLFGQIALDDMIRKMKIITKIILILKVTN